MNVVFKRWAAAAAGAFLALSAQATTVTFNNIGDSFSFVYSASVDGANLSATVSYTLTGAAGNFATFAVSAANTSGGVGIGPIANRMVAFGVALVNPDLANANVIGPGEWNAAINQEFPGDTVVDLCEYAGSDCLDDTGQGVQLAATDNFNVTLKFVSNVGQNPISFSSPFESKWQGVGNSRLMYAVTGCLVGDMGCASEVAQIPEPGSLALGALALFGAAALTRRRPQRRLSLAS